MAPLFSIIIPCFNLERWIRACLDSIISQDFPEWECIVIDDGSTDRTPAILAEYAAKDARIRVITKQNGGVGSARNAGLALARGEWIFFLDGDDVMASDALPALVKLIRYYPQETLFRFEVAAFEDGTPLPEVSRSNGYGRIVNISNRLRFEDYYIYMWQFLFHRSWLEGVHFTAYQRGEDRLFILSLLCFSVTHFVAVPDVLYFYRKREGSAMHARRPSVQMLKDDLSHRLDIIEMMERSPKRIVYRRTRWLEGYCLRKHFTRVEGRRTRYTPAEQAELLEWFYRERPRLLRARGLSLFGKSAVRLYGLSGKKRWRKSVTLAMTLYLFLARQFYFCACRDPNVYKKY